MTSIVNVRMIRGVFIPVFVAIACIALMSNDFITPSDALIIENADFRACSSQSNVKVTLPDNWRSDTRTNLKCGVYEFNFDTTEEQKSIGVLVPSYRFNITFHINDVELSKSKARRNQILPFYTEIPSQLLNRGDNHIRIKLLSDTNGEGFIDKVIIGEPSQLATLDQRLTFYRYNVLQIIAIIILIFAGISFFLYFAEREAREFLYFSLLSCAWVVHILNFIWSDPIFPTHIWMKIVLCGVLTFGTFGCLFVGEFLNVKFPTIDKAIKIMALIWYPTLILLPFNAFWLVVQFVLMPYIMLVAFLTVYKFFTKFRSTSIFTISHMYLGLNTAIIVTGAYDIALMMNLIDDSIIFYLNYSAAGLALCIWFHMFSKYFHLLQTKKKFSHVLENELLTQKGNLEASLERERSAIEKNAALKERDNLMRDLHDSLGSRLMSIIRLSSSGKKTQALAQETLDELRFMTTPLRIEDRDIITLLATFREQRLSRLEEAGYKVTWSVADIASPPEWNTEQAMEFLRILDELLGNALKHGKDDGVFLTLTDDPFLQLTFANNNNHKTNLQESGAGLSSIRIRSQKVGADFSYTTKKEMFIATIHWQNHCRQ